MRDRVLREVGFTGVDLEVADYEEDEFQSARVMASRVSMKVRDPFSIILPPGKSATNVSWGKRQWLSQLTHTIKTQIRVAPSIVSLDNVQSGQGTICIFTAEMDHPFVDGLDANAFEQQRKRLLNSPGPFGGSAVVDSSTLASMA